MSNVDFHALTDKQLAVLLGLHRVNTEMRSIRGPEQIDAVANRIGVSARSLKTVLTALMKKDVAAIRDDRYELSGAARTFARKLIKELSVTVPAEPEDELHIEDELEQPRRRRSSHAECDHPHTKAARAACRKARAAEAGHAA